MIVVVVFDSMLSAFFIFYFYFYFFWKNVFLMPIVATHVYACVRMCIHMCVCAERVLCLRKIAIHKKKLMFSQKKNICFCFGLYAHTNKEYKEYKHTHTHTHTHIHTHTKK